MTSLLLMAFSFTIWNINGEFSTYRNNIGWIQNTYGLGFPFSWESFQLGEFAYRIMFKGFQSLKWYSKRGAYIGMQRQQIKTKNQSITLQFEAILPSLKLIV